MFMFNPNLFLVTFYIKLWLGLLNQVDILGWAPPEKAENTFNYIEIVEEYIQDVVKQCIRQFRSAQIRYFLWLILHTFGNIFLTSFFKLISLSLNFGLLACKKRPKNL